MQWYPQILKDRLILSQPGVADYAHHNTTGPGGFSDHPTALITQTATRYYTSSSTTITTILYVGTKFCSFSTSSYTMAWWREKCRYSATALYSKEGQKSFFPETHGPEIVMEEQPEKHFFWLTLGLHTTGIATVECTASCILS